MNIKEEAIRRVLQLTAEQAEAFLTCLETHQELLQSVQPDPQTFEKHDQ